MSQVTRCPHCSKTLQVADDAGGKQVRCPACKKVFTVRTAPTREPAAAGVGTGSPAGGPRPGGAAAPPKGAPGKPSAESRVTPPPPQAAQPTAAQCPACKATLLPGAISCMDCGYLLQPSAAAEPEGKPNLCPNPACGVANSPKDRHCQRCGAPLPTAPGTVLHGRYRL